MGPTSAPSEWGRLAQRGWEACSEADAEKALEEHDQPSWGRGGLGDSKQGVAGKLA